MFLRPLVRLTPEPESCVGKATKPIFPGRPGTYVVEPDTPTDILPGRLHHAAPVHVGEQAQAEPGDQSMNQSRVTKLGDQSVNQSTVTEPGDQQNGQTVNHMKGNRT